MSYQPKIEYRHCEQCGKRLYSSRAKARQGTLAAHNRIRLYRCPHNDGWHATNEGRDRKRDKFPIKARRRRPRLDDDDDF